MLRSHFVTGLLTNTAGTRIYPVAYAYDYAERMRTMTTWTNAAAKSGTAATTWSYDPYRGFLSGKAYADGNGPTYTYTKAGRLQTRAWARGTTTTYGYNTAGDLASVTSSDGTTPDVTNSYERRARLSSVLRNLVSTSFTYNNASQTLGEYYYGGILQILTVTNGYDGFLRRTNLALLGNTANLLTQTGYRYDAASRLQGVNFGNAGACYGCD